jgi:hypothetical protein
MTDPLKIEEGAYCSLPHFYITHGTYAHTQRRAPTPYNTTPLSGEENMIVALCERVLDLTAVNASLRDLAAPSYVCHKFCLRCAEAKGLRRENDAVPESAHCGCCGNFAPLCQYSAQHVADTYVANKVSSRRAARAATPKKHYYTLCAITHEDKVKILEWMRDERAEMYSGNDGWIKETVLYPGATYRKLVTDKDGYLVDPDYISIQIKAGKVWSKYDAETLWTEPLFSSVKGIIDFMGQGRRYKLKEDV